MSTALGDAVARSPGKSHGRQSRGARCETPEQRALSSYDGVVVKNVLFVPARLLRRGGARRGDGGEGSTLRAAGLRQEADRPQPPRGSHPRRGAVFVVRGDRGARGRDGGLPRTASPHRACQRGVTAAEHDRRDLPARDHSPRAGALRERVHGPADRPRGPRGGRRHDSEAPDSIVLVNPSRTSGG